MMERKNLVQPDTRFEGQKCAVHNSYGKYDWSFGIIVRYTKCTLCIQFVKSSKPLNTNVMTYDFSKEKIDKDGNPMFETFRYSKKEMCYIQKDGPNCSRTVYEFDPHQKYTFSDAYYIQ